MIFVVSLQPENVIIVMNLLKRKVDSYLEKWYKAPNHKPLIINGARQIGKTMSVRAFGKELAVQIFYVDNLPLRIPEQRVKETDKQFLVHFSSE